MSGARNSRTALPSDPMLPGVIALLLLPNAIRPFAEERQLLDRRLETLRRILPDGANPTGDAAYISELLKGARLASHDALARPPLEAGSRGEVLVDVTGTGRFGDIDRFFRQAALSPRLIDVEAVTLSGAAGDLVRFTAVLHLPYRPGRAALPSPPEGLRVSLKDVPRPQAEAYLKDQALALAKAEAIATLRRARRNPRLFLSEMASVVRDRPAVLKEATLADEFLIRGLAVGEGPMRALETRFERGFFRIAEVLMARQGSCYRFEVRGRSPVVGTEAEIPLPSEDPFRQDDTPCQVDRDEGAVLALRGPVTKVPAKGPGGRGAGSVSGPAVPPALTGATRSEAAGSELAKGPHTLRLRGVDLADLFQVLHLVTGRGFVVDEDVRGRVSVDFDRITLEEILEALTRAGLRISETGALLRVSRGATTVTSSPSSTGEGIRGTFALKRATVRDVLAVIGEAEAALAATGPRASLGRVSLWVRDVVLADLRTVVLESASLSERVEDGRRLLQKRGALEEAVVPISELPVERRLIMRPQDLSVQEFQVAGVASAAGGWVAFAYAPTGTLGVYRPGDRLADAAVAQVESTDVLLATDEGPLRFVLQPLAR